MFGMREGGPRSQTVLHFQTTRGRAVEVGQRASRESSVVDRRVSKLISGGDGIRVLGVDPWI
jgi:hypothetical protein